jgi:hypothetical protein
LEWNKALLSALAHWASLPIQRHSHGQSSFQIRADLVTALELAFDNKLLRQICESEAKARSELGASVAGRLKRRLADLRAAASVDELVAGRPRELEGADGRSIVVDLDDNDRIVFSANHSTVPVLESSAVDWSKVSRVKILRIESDRGKE